MMNHIDQLKQAAKIARSVLMILRALLFMCAAALLLFFILLAVSGGRTTLELFAGIPGVQGSAFFLPNLPKSVSAFLTVGLLLAVTFPAQRIFRSISESQLPFTMENARHIRQISLFIGLLAVIPYFFGGVASLIINGHFDGTLNLLEFLVTLVCASIFLCLSYIFSYGANLQKQDDETL